MKDSIYQNYLYDLGSLLKEQALEAKLRSEKTKNTKDYDYNIGYLMAFHSVISLMQQQAKAFGIKEELLGLENINPEIDLL